ncbi:hypothetical protein HHI36_005930 [Cryptolaemus montrouzieri]|uniref:Succinate--hydroxymethylglutarate CoA-transferase n=1 Tax=Cryptolaemus montrouzieri TaxID=559131 RepID=A0ABD2NVK7_9CUCU
MSTYSNCFIKKLKLIRKVPTIMSFRRCNSRSVDVLNDIKILDMTRIIAGPFCTMILSDMGAEVIKVEKPGSGDEARKWGPPFINNSTESSYFVSVNRNKKSVCINLKSEEGRQLIYELAKVSDVLVENYVPGTLERMKLGYDHLKKIAPRLIYCSITGYGSEGPYMKNPGYDVIAASVGGLLNITGPQNGEPVKVGVAVTDLATGLYAHGAILAALIQRSQTGIGQKIECNLLSTQVASLINIGSNYLNNGKEAQRWGSAHESLVPYQMFETTDGYMTIGCGSDSQFKDFCEKIGRPDLGYDEKYHTNALRVENRIELIGIIEGIICQKTSKEWMELFENSSFPRGPVNKIGDVFADPHITAVGLVKTVEHSKIGKIKLVGPPVKYSRGVNEVRSPPPLLGEHTDEVLKRVLGYSDFKIEEFKKRGIVQ